MLSASLNFGSHQRFTDESALAGLLQNRGFAAGRAGFHRVAVAQGKARRAFAIGSDFEI
jgi:hypothetical protein